MWYSVIDGQQQGPFSEAQFNQMIANGSIKLDTLVWKEGQAAWATLAQVRNEISPADACESCQRVVGADHLIELSGFRVCDACKPIVLQKMREGVPVGVREVKRPVGVWIISILYIIFIPLGALSLIFVWWLGHSGLPMSQVQRDYFQSQNLFDHFMAVLGLVFSLGAAIQLFRLRAQALLFFGINFILTILNFVYQIAFKNWWGVMASQPAGYITAAISMLITFGMYGGVLWYVWHLKNKRVLR